MRFLLLSVVFFSACAPGTRETHFTPAHAPERGEISIRSPKAGGGEKLPLLVVFHGYGATPLLQRLYFRFDSFVAEKKFHLAYLSGTPDREKKRFWNASPSCCDLDRSGIDDVSYVDGAIEEIRRRVPVSRVFVAGHSNGGFMAFRLVCDLGAKIDGIFSLAAADEIRRCAVRDYAGFRAVIAHGTGDEVISDQGGSFRGLKPHGTAGETREIWRARLACGANRIESRANSTYGVWGEETRVLREECGERNRLVSITIEGGSHLPWITTRFREEVLDSLLGE